MDRHFMNPKHGEHMKQEEDGRPESADKQDEKKNSSSAKHPSIHVHSHAKGHTVHIMHNDGRHETHEHERGDASGITAHINSHIGGKAGQDHGFSSNDLMEDEDGLGGPGV